MLDQLTPVPTRPARRSAKFEDVAGSFAAALFFGVGLPLITSAVHDTEQQAPSRLSAEATPRTCERVAGPGTLDPVPPRIAELCANYF